MARNIIIYSDGTGQRGGVSFDERRSNIYKMFHATRCGPDSSIDPAEQLAFYDPGLGTLPPNSSFGTFGSLWRLFYNLASQATGLGLTGNIIDCYAAILRMWRPGDRIFLLGFSRGAYTVRCLGGVLAYCGVPTSDRGPSRFTEAGSLKIAKEAVKRVYQHTASRKADTASERHRELLEQRKELARRFREKYRSASSDSPDEPNVYPYFIGVFDTVASLANPVAVMGLAGIVAVVLAIASVVVAAVLMWSDLAPFLRSLWVTFVILALAAGVLALAVNTWFRIRWEIGLPRKERWRILHFTEARMKFYDTDLNPNVAFARHAISIDENRKSFERVRWGRGTVRKPDSTPNWFEQVWFAGNHSDIGGSYIENESRLSDISLRWMAEAAESVGLKVHTSVLRVKPDPTGMQHDEMKRSLVFRYAGAKPRDPPDDAPLHPSVLQRFASPSVVQYDVAAPYRPEPLRNHEAVRHYYR